GYGTRVVPPELLTDGNRSLADEQLVAVCEFDRAVDLAAADFKDGKVRPDIRADERSRKLFTGIYIDLDLLRTFDDVIVRDDVCFVIRQFVDDAGAGARFLGFRFRGFCRTRHE